MRHASMSDVKQEVRTLIETHEHEEDTLHRWLHGKNEWITKCTVAGFAFTLCLAGILFKDVRIAGIALYCVYTFVLLLEWSRMSHLGPKQKDRHILMCIIAIPGLLTFVLAGATDVNIREGLALQAFGMVGLYTFAQLKRHHDMVQSTQRPEA